MKLTNVNVNRKSYTGVIRVLKDVSVEFNRRINVIYGRPGSGKTTLIQVLAGLEKPSQGSVESPDSLMYILMQVPEKQFIYTTCRQELEYGIGPEGSLKQSLKNVGLPEDIMDISPWRLSRGEKKRLMLAQILNHQSLDRNNNTEKRILLLDDPFADMDMRGKKLILDRVLNNNRYKVIMTTANKNDTDMINDNGIDYKLFEISRGRILA
ncbi:MAG: ATP-binding cassette domain-containing protein [Elusimicrobiota bacterium]